jgi:hypothetical protein
MTYPPKGKQLRKREKKYDFFYALSNEGDAWCFWPFFLVVENPRPANNKRIKLVKLKQFI